MKGINFATILTVAVGSIVGAYIAKRFGIV